MVLFYIRLALATLHDNAKTPARVEIISRSAVERNVAKKSVGARE
ncbi:MAG: hypothetical protein PWP14_1751 [Methanolobus sp.]|nr:hypothetical protein [Methanolobus sp.]